LLHSCCCVFCRLVVAALFPVCCWLRCVGFHVAVPRVYARVVVTRLITLFPFTLFFTAVPIYICSYLRLPAPTVWLVGRFPVALPLLLRLRLLPLRLIARTVGAVCTFGFSLLPVSPHRFAWFCGVTLRGLHGTLLRCLRTPRLPPHTHVYRRDVPLRFWFCRVPVWFSSSGSRVYPSIASWLTFRLFTWFPPVGLFCDSSCGYGLPLGWLTFCTLRFTPAVAPLPAGCRVRSPHTHTLPRSGWRTHTHHAYTGSRLFRFTRFMLGLDVADARCGRGSHGFYLGYPDDRADMRSR